MSEQIDDLLLDQKVEELEFTKENQQKDPILGLGVVPGSFTLLSKTLAFYFRNFSRLFTFSVFYFFLIAAIITSRFYFDIQAISYLIFIPAILYVSAFINIDLEEGLKVISAHNLALVKLLPLCYSFLIFLLVIIGFSSLFAIPILLILNQFNYLETANIFIILTFCTLLLPIIIFYSLFLFIAVDEDKYGFKALARSKKYVEVNFAGYLKRLSFCLAALPVIFMIMFYVINGVFIAMDFIFHFLAINDEFDGWKAIIESLAISYNNPIKSYFDLLKYWFIAIVFIIPFIVIYLGFLYSALSCQSPLHSDFDGSLLHRILLWIFLLSGLIVIFFIIYLKFTTNIF